MTQVFGDRPRQSIASHEIQAQRDAWVTAGKSASWINHHLRALSNLYRVLDPDAPSPLRRVREVDEPDAIPRAIPHAVVAAIVAATQPRDPGRFAAWPAPSAGQSTVPVQSSIRRPHHWTFHLPQPRVEDVGPDVASVQT